MKLLKRLKDLYAKEYEVDFEKEEMISYFEEILNREIGIYFEFKEIDDDIFTYEGFDEERNLVCSVEIGLYFFRLANLFCEDNEIKEKIKTLFEKRFDIE